MPSLGFKAEDALTFAAAHDLQIEANQIRSMPIHSSIKRPWSVRKGCFVELYERCGVIDAFIAEHWPTRHTLAGERRRDQYLAQKALNERLLANDALSTTGAAGASEPGTNNLIEAAEATFGLERDLQAALRSNIEQLEPGLRVIDGGQERTTQAGRIDITARDAAGTTIVIELKAGIARPEALTQLLAYVGVMAGKEQRPPRGILIAEDFHPRVVFGARAVPSIQLWRYRFKFTFEKCD
jgi:Endonuclease NucS C-terminal domain